MNALQCIVTARYEQLPESTRDMLGEYEPGDICRAHIDGGSRQVLTHKQVAALEAAGYTVDVTAGLSSTTPWAEEFEAFYGVVVES